MKPVIALSSVLLVIGIGLAGLWVQQWRERALQTSKSKGTLEAAGDGVVATPDLVAAVKKELEDADWNEEAAQSVVQFNRDWLAAAMAAKVADPNSSAHLMTDLKALGKYPGLGLFLKQHPETAGLLATQRDPKAVAESLQGANADYPLLASLYLSHSCAEDAADLAQALKKKKNREQVIRLVRRGLVGAEALFIYPRCGEADRKYELWMQELVDDALAGSDEDLVSEKLASAVQLLLNQGAVIRELMAKDIKFRESFSTVLWPKLARAAAAPPNAFALESFLDERGIWEFLELSPSENLLKDWGVLPATLLCGANRYPAIFHEQILQAFQADDKLTVLALVELDTPRFRDFLTRCPPSKTRAAALKRLLDAEPGNRRALLEKYCTLTAPALEAEVGPPPGGVITWVPGFPVYLVGKKLYEGREPAALEWGEAALELGSFLVPLAKGAKVAGAAARGGRGAFSVTLKNTGLKMAEKRLGPQVAQKLAERELTGSLLNWSVKGLLKELPQQMRGAAANATTVDVTACVRLMHTYGGTVGKKTACFLTGLEARLFMRKDARVYLHLGKTAVARWACERINVGAKKAIPELLNYLVENNLNAALPENAALPNEKEMQNWREHVSAWFFYCLANSR